MVIAIDFDGTVVTHEFPRVGKDIGAVPVLERLLDCGHELILWTMRSDRQELGETNDHTIQDVTGNFLQDAIDWFDKNGIKLHAVQRNPTQDFWTTSPKCYAQLYIDDAALGCPLRYDPKISSRPFVDWQKVEIILETMNLI